MITIALDEQGDFENFYKKGANTDFVFIGGIIYNDKGDGSDSNNERRRINRYLKCVCEEVGASYPRDLHVNNTGNAKVVRKVKKRITETLAGFLSKGVYPDNKTASVQSLQLQPKRKGEYHIFAIVKRTEGKNAFIEHRENNLIRDDYASNLYIHMAQEIVERIIFHNPIISDIDRIHPELATRRAVLDKKDYNTIEEYQQKVEQYISLGYREDMEHKEPERRTFILTNADNYRTAIEREMFDTEKQEIGIEKIGVKSIYYGHETANNKMEFLYMADIICSMLGFELENSSPEQFIWNIKERADRYTGKNDNLIFVYDRVDTRFRKSWIKLEEKDYYEALSIAYDLEKLRSPFVDFYKKVWLPCLEKKLLDEEDISAYSIAVKKIYNSSRANNLEQDKILYIFEILQKMGENIQFRYKEDKSVLYELYDAGVAVYCHLGDSDNAKLCFEKCKEYATYIGVERYLRTRNKMVVYLDDYFIYKDAVEIAEENVLYHEDLIKIKREIFNENLEDTKGYLIAKSQLGQAYAYSKNEMAESEFLSALEKMEEGSPDYWITMSYLLHYYIDKNEKEKYDVFAKKYFGNHEKLWAQFHYIISEGSQSEPKFSLKFALYVYIKGVQKFHSKNLNAKTWERLYEIEKTMKMIGGENALQQINGHPWEIIYKHLALIALKRGKIKEADDCMDKARNILKYGGYTLDMICLFGELEYAKEKGGLEELKGIMRKLQLSLSEDNWLYQKLERIETAEGKYEYLKNEIFTYMYC